MAVAAGGADESATEGFPAVPELVPAAAGAEPTRAEDRCLGLLDLRPVPEPGPQLPFDQRLIIKILGIGERTLESTPDSP